MKKIMVLGAGELGKEFVISAQRLGQYTIAVDKYRRAPAMQVAHEFEVIDMLDPDQLESIVKKHKPDIIVPEIEAIRTEKLEEFEKRGIFVVPTARATYLTMNRDAIRDVAAKELKLKTAQYKFAESEEELVAACKSIGFPCVIKPLMSSSGKGQTVAKSEGDVSNCWTVACRDARGDSQKVIVEEFINFTTEITLLTVKQKSGPTYFIKPIGHRQESGDYRESWLPAEIKPELLNKAQIMAKTITDNLGGAGLYGVEFFITESDVYFSELSPRPHDTGMVTLVGQNLSEFDLHLRAILGLPIQKISYFSEAAASYAILADQESSEAPEISGIEEALKLDDVDLRIFNKPSTRKNRRMAVTLATGADVAHARKKARDSAAKIKLKYN